LTNPNFFAIILGMKYNFFSDPGHGWLCVPTEQIRTLGLTNKISQYSYMRDNVVFLEEDCDAPLFVEAAKAAGWAMEFSEINTDNDSNIRRFKRYNPELI